MPSTRYLKEFSDHLPGFTGRQQGNLTPRTLNSLSAIAGHEGEEEDWEREMRDLRGDDEVSHYRDRRYRLRILGRTISM